MMPEKPAYYFKPYKMFDNAMVVLGLLLFTLAILFLVLKGIDFLSLYVKNSY